MARRIIYCITCNAKYDVSQVTSGSRFVCKTCETIIKVPVRSREIPEPFEVPDASEPEIIPADRIVAVPGMENDLNGLSFTKMVGTGNDFVLVDCIREPVENPEEAARVLCDRRFGVGANGLLLLLPEEEADIRMRMFNPDGSEAEACGNGLRCLVKYAFDHGHVDGRVITVDTKAGLRFAETTKEGDVVVSVRVGMGIPSTAPGEIPVKIPGENSLRVRVDVLNQVFEGTAVSLGNPHYVLFVPDVDAVDVSTLGPALENHSLFPNRTNVEFVEVISPSKVRQRTWERGAGETLACGSGACAAVVAGNLHDRTEKRITVSLRGGDLELEWTESGEVFLEGPAEELFTGLWCKS